MREGRGRERGLGRELRRRRETGRRVLGRGETKKRSSDWMEEWQEWRYADERGNGFDAREGRGWKG